jgi:hypothetical protein
MERVTRCLHCGKRTVPVPSLHGRSRLQCVTCDLEPRKMEATARVENPFPASFGSPLPVRTA